ncbi:hypothetical protein BKA70DRAFT_1231439 [Coprinopsis sp. MPI-PUGE-AT-0042]|nr:hypothetical protein BKA70DRAFT_1231439 [Coprinopsis sp. MPI-PUGE-AT-0042]
MQASAQRCCCTDLALATVLFSDDTLSVKDKVGDMVRADQFGLQPDPGTAPWLMGGSRANAPFQLQSVHKDGKPFFPRASVGSQAHPSRWKAVRKRCVVNDALGLLVQDSESKAPRRWLHPTSTPTSRANANEAWKLHINAKSHPGQATKRDQTRAFEIDIAIHMIQVKSLWPGHWVSFARSSSRGLPWTPWRPHHSSRLRLWGLHVQAHPGRYSEEGPERSEGHSLVTENVWFSLLFSSHAVASAIFPFHHLLAGLIAPYGLFVHEHTTVLRLGPKSGCQVAGRNNCRALGLPTTCAYPLRLVVDPSPRPVKE